MTPPIAATCKDCNRPFEAKTTFARFCPSCRWTHRGRPRTHLWTPERDAFLRDRYDPRVKGRVNEIAAALRVPKWVVSRRAGDLGLRKPRGETRAWTPADDRFLESHAGTRLVGWMAKQLDRTPTAVAVRLKRLRISRRIREGYTLRDLQLCLGVDHRPILGWVRSGKLEARHRYSGELEPSFNRDAWHFTDEGVLRFLLGHPTAYELARVDQDWFLGLVRDPAVIRPVLAHLANLDRKDRPAA